MSDIELASKDYVDSKSGSSYQYISEDTANKALTLGLNTTVTNITFDESNRAVEFKFPSEWNGAYGTINYSSSIAGGGTSIGAAYANDILASISTNASMMVGSIVLMVNDYELTLDKAKLKKLASLLA